MGAVVNGSDFTVVHLPIHPTPKLSFLCLRRTGCLRDSIELLCVDWVLLPGVYL